MKKCELLVPAGGPKQFIAAVENGADAVYVGGKSFNARANAQNFSDKEIEQAIDYAHVRNVKTYIAMNTLLEDDEIEKACEKACEYYSMGADAIIIQDLGLGRALKDRLPDFPLHLSTQAGVYNSKGVEAASKLGYERVVMARELTFDEIKEAVNAGAEIEVFVHGALCICYSGQCQLSRFIGGRSGNKGVCAQPCRLPYKGLKGERYPLSPKDLCLIEEVGKLAEAGVASLKIEGRMKSAEYVAIVTAVYRKYLDEWYRNGSYRVSKEDMEALKQAFNRGGFTKGYFYADPGEELMASDLSKNAGVFVGTVRKNSNGPLAEINIEKEIAKGDYIEIRSDEPMGSLVTYAENTGKGRMRIGDIKSKVKQGDEVYRLTSYEMMRRAQKTFENITFERGKFIRKSPVKLEATVAAGRELSLEARALGQSARVVSRIIPEAADGGKSCEKDVKKQLARTGGTAFDAASIIVKEVVPAYVPLSAANSLRREALSELEEKIKQSHKRSIKPAAIPVSSKESPKTNKILEIYFYDKEDFLSKSSKAILDKCREIAGNDMMTVLVPIYQYEECRAMAGSLNVRLCPYVASMSKGANEQWLEDNLEHIAGLLLHDGAVVYVGNIGQIQMFSDAGVEVCGDFGMNISNEQAAAAYKKLGMRQWRKSLECTEYGSGAMPLMISEHKFKDAVLTDRKGARYSIEFDKSINKSILKSLKSTIDWQKVKSDYENGSVRIYV